MMLIEVPTQNNISLYIMTFIVQVQEAPNISMQAKFCVSVKIG